MTTATDYAKQANELLERLDVQFKVVLVGDDCPQFCKDAQAGRDMDKVNTFPRKTHIHGKHYRCELARQNTNVFFDFWNSYADEEFNAMGTKAFRNGETAFKYAESRGKPTLKGKRTPTAYDLLACLTKSDPGTFHNFCADFGYDEDSRKAERIYEAVCEEWRKVRDFFTEAELELLQEIA